MTGGCFTRARDAAERARTAANASAAVDVIHDPPASTTAAHSVAEQEAVPPNAPPPKKSSST